MSDAHDPPTDRSISKEQEAHFDGLKLAWARTKRHYDKMMALYWAAKANGEELPLSDEMRQLLSAFAGSTESRRPTNNVIEFPGHKITIRVTDDEAELEKFERQTNDSDPMGMVLSQEQWEQLAERARASGQTVAAYLQQFIRRL